jgi:hypothetical protein
MELALLGEDGLRAFIMPLEPYAPAKPLRQTSARKQEQCRNDRPNAHRTAFQTFNTVIDITKLHSEPRR